MIPKIIHYCWFGKNKMPTLAKKCIKSWKKYLPEYEYKFWNEKSFDLDMVPYAREAYECGKYAFVTDVVRMYALYNYGGVYMDTDVEMLKPLDSYLHHSAFSGFESKEFFPTGLMAAEKYSQWARENLEWYNGKHFIKEDGTMDVTTNIFRIMEVTMKNHNVRLDDTLQDIPGYLTVYPSDYFCPSDFRTHKIDLTKNSVCIHHFAGSWLPKPNKKPPFLNLKVWMSENVSLLYNVLHRVNHFKENE